MKEVVSYGIVRVVRSKFWYLVLRGSVVVSTHWTKRSALRSAHNVASVNDGANEFRWVDD